MPLPKAGSNAFYSNSFLIFITRFFPSLANLLVLLWYSRQLPVEIYGHYSQFWIQVNMSYPLICFGIHVLLITYSKDVLVLLMKQLKPLHYGLFIVWTALLSGIFSLLLKERLGISFIVPFLFISSFAVSIIFESCLIVFRNFKTLVSVNILYSIAFFALHWYLLGHDFSLANLFYYLLIISVLRLIIYLIAVVIDLRTYLSEADPVTLPAVGDLRSLWLHLGIYDLVQNLSSWVDKFIVSLVLSSGLSAIYFNGSQNIPFLPVLLSAAGSSVLMQLAAGKKKDEHTDAIRLMNQSGRVLSCIVFPVFFYLLIYSHDVVIIMLTDKYKDVIPVFIAYLFVLPVRAYSFTTVLQRMHKGAIINTGAVSEIVLALLLIYPLYSWLGLPGVALSFVISTWYQAGFYLFFSARLLQTSVLQLLPFRNWLVKLIVFGSLFIGIHYITSLFFTGRIVLFLGGAVLLLSIGGALLLELKQTKQKHVDPESAVS